MSSASFSSIVSAWRGERGSAMSPIPFVFVSLTPSSTHHPHASPNASEEKRGENYDSPVLALSKIPNGAINFIKLSIREGLAESSTMQLLVLISNIFPPN